MTSNGHDKLNRRRFLRRLLGGAVAATPIAFVTTRGGSSAAAQTPCTGPQPSSTVADERNLAGNGSSAGSAASYSRGDHSHGTPRPREPQAGTNYVALASGGSTGARLEFGSDRSGGDLAPGHLRSTGAGSETEFAGPIAAAGWGRPAYEMYGYSDGTCKHMFYNDLDVNGAYGATGGGSKGSKFDLDCGDHHAGDYLNSGLLVRSSQREQIAVKAGNVASMWLIEPGLGNVWHAVNSAASDYVPLWAQGFITKSTLASKRNVRTLESTREALGRLRPVRYQHHPTPTTDDSPRSPAQAKNDEQDRLGLVAEEVAAHLPEAIAWGKDGRPEGVNYAVITAALLQTVNALAAEVAVLKAQQ